MIEAPSLLHSWASWSNSFSYTNLKLGIMSAAAFNPGISTFILNLIRSSGNFSLKKAEEHLWLVEYT